MNWYLNPELADGEFGSKATSEIDQSVYESGPCSTSGTIDMYTLTSGTRTLILVKDFYTLCLWEVLISAHKAFSFRFCFETCLFLIVNYYNCLD